MLKPKQQALYFVSNEIETIPEDYRNPLKKMINMDS